MKQTMGGKRVDTRTCHQSAFGEDSAGFTRNRIARAASGLIIASGRLPLSLQQAG